MCVCVSKSAHRLSYHCVSSTPEECVYLCYCLHTSVRSKDAEDSSHERQKTRPLLQVHICLRSKEPWLHAQLRVDLLYSYFCSRTLTLSQIQLYSDACPVQGLGGAFPSSHRVTGRVRPLFFVLKCFTLILLVITFNVRVIFPNYINVFFFPGAYFSEIMDDFKTQIQNFLRAYSHKTALITVGQVVMKSAETET